MYMGHRRNREGSVCRGLAIYGAQNHQNVVNTAKNDYENTLEHVLIIFDNFENFPIFRPPKPPPDFFENSRKKCQKMAKIGGISKIITFWGKNSDFADFPLSGHQNACKCSKSVVSCQ